ncbi:MAG: flagellar hook-basal body complex protein FliE [Acidobacteria bacterium]|nr:flagellar hook-basal body complex protein FliE [Acidobacteriota bacterium]
MAAPILPISPSILPDAIRPAGQPSGGTNFKDVLSSAVETVEAAGRSASTAVEKFLSGEGEELHTTILATQRAELSFDLFMQARNKAVSAYQEIMRMQM